MDKIKVQRANIELDINPEDKEYYMKQGYSVVNGFGQVLEQAVPNDVNTLQILVAKLKKENEQLKAKLAEQDAPKKEVTTTPKKRGNAAKQ